MKTLSTATTIGAGCLAFAMNVSADLIVSVLPDAQTIQVGETTSIALVISGLPTTLVPVPAAVTGLGAYSLTLGFDPSVISATAVTFLSPPESKLDLGVFGSLEHSDLTVPGAVELDETSLEDTAALRQSQYVNVDSTTLTASFTLASISFTGLAVGSAPVYFLAGDLSDAAGLPLTGNVFGLDGTITVVPEPAVFAVVGGLGLVAFAWARRRGRHQAHPPTKDYSTRTR
jgi:hypothetical protein